MIPDRRPRALFFTNFPPPYTGQTICTQLAAGLLGERFEVVPWNTSDGDFNLARGVGAKAGRTLRLLRHTAGAARRLRSEPCEVLYLVPSSQPLGHLRDLLTLRRLAPRVTAVVAHVHSGNFQVNFERPLLGALTRRWLGRVDAFIFLSHLLAERCAPWVGEARRFVVPNTIEGELRLNAAEVERKLAERGSRQGLRVLFLSNMIPSKGYLDLAHGIARARQRTGAEVTADFVGGWMSETERRAFEGQLGDLGLAGAARVHGTVSSRPRVRELMIAADVLALPTYYPVEAQPLCLLEAMNAATPVIATAHASIPEYVDDGVNGFLVDPRSPAQIADRLERLLAVDGWRAMAAAARRTYEERFDHRHFAERIQAVFTAVTRHGAATPT